MARKSDEDKIEKRFLNIYDQIKSEFRLFFSECSLTVSHNFYYHQSCPEVQDKIEGKIEKLLIKKYFKVKRCS